MHLKEIGREDVGWMDLAQLETIGGLL